MNARIDTSTKPESGGGNLELNLNFLIDKHQRLG